MPSTLSNSYYLLFDLLTSFYNVIKVLEAKRLTIIISFLLSAINFSKSVYLSNDLTIYFRERLNRKSYQAARDIVISIIY